MVIVSYLTECRICKSDKLLDVISLGEQYITSRFPIYGDFSTPKTSIVLCMCELCGLIQLRETTNCEELYEYEYGYRSGINNTMRTHLKDYNTEMCNTINNLKDGDIVLDIGSNDSTMLQNYSEKYRRIGIDPTGNQFIQYYNNIELLPTYFTYDNFNNTFGSLKCKIVSSISMFYDLPDPVQFAKDIYNILDDNGIWTCEQSYILTMLRSNSIDTICHEHLEYYSLHQIKDIADRANFKIINVLFNDCNGGSFRVYFAKKNSMEYKENTELINSILKEEDDYGIMNPQTYINFMTNCDIQVKLLKDFIENANLDKKKIYIYGASTKGNCLLQYANIGENDIKYAVERNLSKVGKMTSTGIEIISEETMRNDPPDYLFVLPYHFKKEIIERENDFLEFGGEFIFPFPQFQIIGSKPKALITGCDGMIAHYIKEQFVNTYNLYGITRNIDTLGDNKHITKFQFDINNIKKLENTLKIINPDVIIHLASISSSQYAFNNPLETIKTNGLITAEICNFIHKNSLKHIKLFNASSSEIYKGHIDYEVTEDDKYMYHTHPYSIAKILGHSIIDFYRETYGYNFSNGIIFTAESAIKRPEFLLNKIALHAKKWNSGIKEPITVGNLESYRNILHAKDVASAINTIVSQTNGDNYIIAGDESYKIFDLVIKIYLNNEIHLKTDDSITFYELNTGLLVFEIENVYKGFDSVPTNIRGESKKLKKLGWTPIIHINNILDKDN